MTSLEEPRCYMTWPVVAMAITYVRYLLLKWQYCCYDQGSFLQHRGGVKYTLKRGKGRWKTSSSSIQGFVQFIFVPRGPLFKERMKSVLKCTNLKDLPLLLRFLFLTPQVPIHHRLTLPCPSYLKVQSIILSNFKHLTCKIHILLCTSGKGLQNLSIAYFLSSVEKEKSKF